jgi:hypothetical protein
VDELNVVEVATNLRDYANHFEMPSVGTLVADWMLAEPDNPHARKIAGEMQRIQDAYAERTGP